MKKLSWRNIAILIIIIGSLIYTLPTLNPGIWPHKKINLGLDLQGGMHLVLEVDADKAVASTIERIGQELRRMLLHMESKDIVPEAELFLYLADRAQHVAQVIRPALQHRRIVLSDRFADSTIVYQGYGRGFDPRLLKQLRGEITL